MPKNQKNKGTIRELESQLIKDELKDIILERIKSIIISKTSQISQIDFSSKDSKNFYEVERLIAEQLSAIDILFRELYDIYRHN
jgi:hypothetical protein